MHFYKICMEGCSEFWIYLYKMWYFFYYTTTNASTLKLLRIKTLQVVVISSPNDLALCINCVTDGSSCLRLWIAYGFGRSRYWKLRQVNIQGWPMFFERKWDKQQRVGSRYWKLRHVNIQGWPMFFERKWDKQQRVGSNRCNFYW